ncbi:MAG: sigma-70 family RNA polymerase sigma factor [Spirochaetes bacterium]|nr:sigma-70 family RNA polymerase sigma factor [Spirochaetota bacterium]
MLNERDSDEQIVRVVLDGQNEKFKFIVKRYQTYIYNIGMRFFGNEDDSLDFTQDVLLKAYTELKSFSGKASFRAWIIKIAYNYGINKIKAAKHDKAEIDDNISGGIGPEKSHFKNEVSDLLKRSIDALPYKYSICLDLYFFMGFKYDEINNITGFPVNTIKSNVRRAKQILREKLRGSMAEDYHEM